MKRLDGSMELQLVDQVGEWLAVPVVTEVSEAQEAENQKIAAQLGILPAQVQRMRELGIITIPALPTERGPGA